MELELTPNLLYEYFDKLRALEEYMRKAQIKGIGLDQVQRKNFKQAILKIKAAKTLCENLLTDIGGN